jgi:hypothetical protein
MDWDGDSALFPIEDCEARSVLVWFRVFQDSDKNDPRNHTKRTNKTVSVRVCSWIVPVVQKTKDDPRSHTKQHEPKHSYPELNLALRAKLLTGKKSADKVGAHPKRARLTIMSPFQGERYLWLVDPGVARETRLPRAIVCHAFGVRTCPANQVIGPQASLPLP